MAEQPLIKNGQPVIDAGAPVVTGDPSTCDCCCDLSECPYPDTSTGPDRLRIKNYQDGDLQPCSDCDNSSDPAWDGTFPRRTDTCDWRKENTNLSMDGKLLQNDAVLVQLVVSSGSFQETWKLLIVCETNGQIWQGFKDCSDDGSESPVGVYTRDSGCDTTSTLEIESY